MTCSTPLTSSCDLKAENVVFQTTVADDFLVKIINFGTVLSLQSDSDDDVLDYIKRGTDSLIVPETDCLYYRLRKYMYSKQTDIWQAGASSTSSCSQRCLSEWAKRPHGRSTTASRPPSATCCHPSSTVAFPTTPRTSSCACWTSTPSKSCCIAGSDRTAGCPTKTSTQSAYGHRPIASEYRYTMAAN